MIAKCRGVLHRKKKDVIVTCFQSLIQARKNIIQGIRGWLEADVTVGRTIEAKVRRKILQVFSSSRSSGNTDSSPDDLSCLPLHSDSPVLTNKPNSPSPSRLFFYFTIKMFWKQILSWSAQIYKRYIKVLVIWDFKIFVW